MIKKILKSLLLATLLVLMVGMSVLAAAYTADINVTESEGTSYTYLPIIADVDNDTLADGGYITSTGLDTRVLLGSDELSHMLASDKVLFVSNIGADGVTTFDYTSGNSALSYFPIIVGYDGYITVTDNGALEPGNNFEFEADGYIDTTVGWGKNIFYKPEAFRIYVSDTQEVSGAIATAFTEQLIPDSHTEE